MVGKQLISKHDKQARCTAPHWRVAGSKKLRNTVHRMATARNFKTICSNWYQTSSAFSTLRSFQFDSINIASLLTHVRLCGDFPENLKMSNKRCAHSVLRDVHTLTLYVHGCLFRGIRMWPPRGVEFQTKCMGYGNPEYTINPNNCAVLAKVLHVHYKL